MKTILYVWWILALLLAVGFALGCGDDDSIETGQGNLPAVPIPRLADGGDLPEVSGERVVGMSNPIDNFLPKVTRLLQMQDNGSESWISIIPNRHLALACPGSLPRYSNQPGLTYISARPRLLHVRYWKKIMHQQLSPNTAYSQEHSVTHGCSSTDTRSEEFSQTIGVSATAGGAWKAFSVEVSAYYEQTSTVSQVHSVTWSEEDTLSRRFTAPPADEHSVYAIWQLVDKFSYVDENRVPIHQSPTLVNVEISPIRSIEFLREDHFAQPRTFFD